MLSPRLPTNPKSQNKTIYPAMPTGAEGTRRSAAGGALIPAAPRREGRAAAKHGVRGIVPPPFYFIFY